jgi:hypothetical protein
MISVKQLKDEKYEVTVSNGTTTTHAITLSDTYYKKLSGSKVPPELLIEKSFEFLLEREPNTSILRNFELSVIGRYFPEYERTISKLLA